MKLAVGVTLAAALAACAAAPKIATGTDEVAALRGRWVTAINGHDARALPALYAADAIYLPITGNRVVSALAIGNLYARIWERFAPRIELEPHAIERRGELAYESGDYTESVTAPEGALVVAGAYVFVYRRDPAGWVLATQVWTEKPARGLE